MRHQLLTLMAATDACKGEFSCRRPIESLPLAIALRRFYITTTEWVERRRVFRAARENGNHSEVRARMRVIAGTRKS